MRSAMEIRKVRSHPSGSTSNSAFQRACVTRQLRVTHRIRIQQRQQANLLAGGLELASHLKSNHSSQRTAADKIRAIGLKLAYLFDVVSSHLANLRVRRLLAIQPA